MNQTRTHSVIEATANTMSGFIISWAVTVYLIPLTGYFIVTEQQGFWIVCIYTVASLVRNYVWRRVFNGRA